MASDEFVSRIKKAYQENKEPAQEALQKMEESVEDFAGFAAILRMGMRRAEESEDTSGAQALIDMTKRASSAFVTIKNVVEQYLAASELLTSNDKE